MAYRVHRLSPNAMRRVPLVRLVTLIAMLLVAATPLAGRVIGDSECDCCGPMLAGPAVPVPPCCIGTTERRMAPLTVVHHGSTPQVALHPEEDVRSGDALVLPEPDHPPGRSGPLYLRISVLRI